MVVWETHSVCSLERHLDRTKGGGDGCEIDPIAVILAAWTRRVDPADRLNGHSERYKRVRSLLTFHAGLSRDRPLISLPVEARILAVFVDQRVPVAVLRRDGAADRLQRNPELARRPNDECQDFDALAGITRAASVNTSRISAVLSS